MTKGPRFGLSIESVRGDRWEPEKVTAFRAIVFEAEYIEGQETPVLSVDDIYEWEIQEDESPLQALLNLQGFWSEHPNSAKVTGVYVGSGRDFEEPDCLTVWEAAEASASFPVDLFHPDPLGIRG